MGERAPQIAPSAAGDIPVGLGADQKPCEHTKTQGGKTLAYGVILAKTVRHFWPQLPTWMGALTDTRLQPLVIYDRRFLLWWGILDYQLRLGSRRQLDFQLRDLDTFVLENVNRLAGTSQQSLPHHKTLDHFLGHTGSTALMRLRTHCIRRLVRMKALDSLRLSAYFVVAVDGTGYLKFTAPHCPQCLTQKHSGKTIYFHPVLEAKIVDPAGFALSIGSEFIENTDCPRSHSEWNEQLKQDCELKAFGRLARHIKQDFPQTPLCISGDSIYGCGSAIRLCRQMGWRFVLVFKPGRTPALWREFQALLKLQSENRLRRNLPDGTTQRVRWVNQLPYQDSEGHTHVLDALICEETAPDGATTTFAWLTDFTITRTNVIEIAEKGGRVRAKIENQGFNIQKHSGYNMEHAYSQGQDTLKCFYILLQLAHMILQMVEKGSLLRNLARDYTTTTAKLIGSIRNLSCRLLECLRYFRIPDEAFDVTLAAACQIRLDSG